MAAYGAPTGYGPGADAAVTTEHHHRQQPLITHPQGHPHSPSFPYPVQHSPRGPHQDSFFHDANGNVSPAFPTSGSSGGGHYTTSPVVHDSFEIPPAKRQKIGDTEIGRRRPSQHTAAAGTQTPPAQREGMEKGSPPGMRGNDASRGREKSKGRRESASIEPGASISSPIISKPKRVRTGCLTCRNRHLKCDEAMPVCLNCQKSNRKCERGVRLNFIDLKVEQPPYLLPPVDWKGKFSHVARRCPIKLRNGSALVAVFHRHGKVLRDDTSY